MQAFPLPVLPERPAQVPVLANDCTMHGREDGPTRIERVLSPSQRDRADRCESYRTCTLTSPCGRGFSFCSGGAAATATATVAAAVTSAVAAAVAPAATAAAAAATSPVGPGDKVSKSRQKDQLDVSTPLQIRQYWLKQEGVLTPRGV